LFARRVLPRLILNRFAGVTASGYNGALMMRPDVVCKHGSVRL